MQLCCQANSPYVLRLWAQMFETRGTRYNHYCSNEKPQDCLVRCSASVRGYFRQLKGRSAYILQTARPFSSNPRNGQTFGSLQQAPQRRQEPFLLLSIDPKAVKNRRNFALHVLQETSFFVDFATKHPKAVSDNLHKYLLCCVLSVKYNVFPVLMQ
jgi:hypothetical protein